VKTTQYVATSGAAIALTVLVSGLMSDLWSALALHLPF
jgi:hypothetical protein